MYTKRLATCPLINLILLGVDDINGSMNQERNTKTGFTERVFLKLVSCVRNIIELPGDLYSFCHKQEDLEGTRKPTEDVIAGSTVLTAVRAVFHHIDKLASRIDAAMNNCDYPQA